MLGVTAYQVQFSLDEAFTDDDEIIDQTADQTSYRRENLPGATPAHLRVRSSAGTADALVHSAWSTHVTGMTETPEPHSVETEPCAGVLLRAELPSRLNSPDHFTTRLVIELSPTATETFVDLLGPYWIPGWRSEIWEPLSDVHIGDWDVVTEGDTLRHEIEVTWPDAEFRSGGLPGSADLRLAFAGAHCVGQPVFTCSADGCELRP